MRFFKYLSSLLIIFCSYCNLYAAVLSNIQTGTAIMGAGDITEIVAITGVDLTKSILIFSVRSNANEPGTGQFAGYLSATDTITFQRYAAGPQAAIEWTVYEFASGVTVQRGLKDSVGHTGNNVAISAVNTSESFAIVTVYKQGLQLGRDDGVTGEITSSTNLFLSRESGGNSDNRVAWQVVEWTGANVEKVVTTLSAGVDSATYTLTSAVTRSKAMVVGNHRISADVSADDMPGTELIDGNTVQFSRVGTTADMYFVVYVVEFTDNTDVVHGQIRMTPTETTVSATICDVFSTSTAGIWPSGNMNRSGNNCMTTDDHYGFFWPTYSLINSTTVQCSRTNSGVSGLFPFQVLEFSASTPAACTDPEPGASSHRTADLCTVPGSSITPGDVSSNLELWLKADDGPLNGASAATGDQAVNTWEDRTTARTNDATDANNTAPIFRNNTSDNINYNPVVDFDGTTHGLDFGNDYIFSTGAGSEDGMTWFAVATSQNRSAGKNSQYIMDFGFVAPNGYGFHYRPAAIAAYTPGAVSSVAHSFDTLPTLIRFTIDFGTDQTVTFNGAATALATTAIATTALTATEIAEASSPAGSSGPFSIGRQSKSGLITSNEGRRLDGSIAEVIGYKEDVSPTAGGDIPKIESYLAVKYGITLDNTGGSTAGDYTSSEGTTIWDASDGAAYHNDVIGIGRDDSTALFQKQSHQLDDSTRLYIAILDTTNSGNTGVFSTDTQFVLMGHDADVLHSNGSTEYPGAMSIFSRLEREWKITNSEFTGTFSVDITLSSTANITASDLRILIDTDGDFSNATMHSPTITVSDRTVTISGLSTSEIPANSTRYMTLVSLSSNTPLPVELISFNARLDSDNNVQLDWQTASEINNDYFTVQRSKDGVNWEFVVAVDGAGNSSELLSYASIDKVPFAGVSYYRLKQTDFDGGFSYSEIKGVNIGDPMNASLEIYPNPAENEINILGGEFELKQIKIFNVLGQDVTFLTTQMVKSKSKLVLDLSNLTAGMYYLKTKNTANKVYKK